MFIPDGIIYTSPTSSFVVSGSEENFEFLEDFEMPVRPKHVPSKPGKESLKTTAII